MTNSLSIRRIDTASLAHLAALELRLEILRRPLGLSAFSEAELAREPEAVHFGAFVAPEADMAAPEQLVGTLLLQKTSAGDIQMRQVAVAQAWQHRGVGKRLVEAAESYCQKAHVRGSGVLLFAHARRAAVPFYERL